MKKIYHILFAVLALTIAAPAAWSQSSPNCVTASDDDYLYGRTFFNFGSVTRALNTKVRINSTVGQPVVGGFYGPGIQGTHGFWSSFLLPPAAPIVMASEGDLEDRVQIDWTPDPLSPAATSYKLYRNGSLLATVDGETFSFIDFNVLAGKFYTYEVAGVNSFGEGFRGAALGFLNPNGVVTGQVKSSNNNPVPGAVVTLTPTIGASALFGGDDMAFAEYNASFPTTQFTLSCWVKIDDGNDNTAIFDFGSHIGKNWWLHTLPAADGRGVRFGMANGSGGVTELEYAFPEATAEDWHNVAVSFSGASVLLYVDGELIETAVTGHEAGQSPLFLGQKSDATGFYTGGIDEVRFYNRQLAQTEIQMFLNRTVAPNAAGLVNYWKFDEGVGSKSFDLTSTKQKLYFCGASWSSDKPNVVNAGLTDETGFYAIPGINYGAGTTFVATPSKKFYFNQSLEFNSVNNQYAELTDFDLSDSSTVEVTVKAFDFSGNQCILTKQNGSTTHFGLHLNAGNIILEMGGNQHDFGPLTMGFHRLSFVIDKPAGSSDAAVTLYRNGDLVGSHTFGGVASDFSGGSVWTLGAGSSGGSLVNYFSGLIDDVVFYNSLVSLPDLQLAAAVGTDLRRGDLMNYFPLNEGSGDKLKDYGFSLSGKGTIYGATYSTVAAILNEEPHLFTPSSRLVTLNPSNTSVDQVDFTDQSTVPVSGYVRYDGTDCFQEGVEILVNGKRASPPVFTDNDGYFSIEFEPGATAQLTPVFRTHTYYPAFWEIDNIVSPVAGVLFRNQVKRHIQGQMAGNAICRKSVIPEGAIVKVKVETLDGCYYKEQQLTESNGKFKFDKLPPLPIIVAVTEHSNNIIYDYFQLQGGKEVDLTDVSDTTDFIYYSQPQIELTMLDTNACGQQMLEQGAAYSTEIKVYQPYDGGRCYLDTAMLTIDNQIADMASFDTLMTTGKLKHKFKASFPNIASPYTKTLTVAAEANTIQNSISTTAVVLGQRPRAVNFTSTSPSIPLMILRDPPGDGSNATIEKGTTVCNGWGVGTSLATKVSTGVKLSLGTKTVVSSGVGAEVETTTELKNELEMGMSVTTKGNFNTSAEVCLTTNETISTSGDAVLQGEDADVFVGGALNLLFGVTDDLRFDTNACDYYIKPDLVVFPDKFASTFLYSGYQIKKVVIPNLEFVGDTASANQWRDILQRNRDLKDQAVFEKNLTFDAGVTYENSTTIENTKSMAYGFGVDISANIGAELGFLFNGTGATFKLGVQIDMGVSSEFSNTQSNSQTVGYTLADDDIKDVFTVDVLQDRVYGTPVFRTISGNSSCPYEEKTVPRDGLTLTVDKTIATNVLENDVAVFKFNVGNVSQTDEYRYYSLALYNATNPEGAVVKVQGENKSSGNFLIAPGQSQEVTVTIGRGPNAYDYENLSFYAISDCEGARYDALGNGDWPPEPFFKQIDLDVYFLEPCSPIDIGFPLQNWVMTPADGNIVFITLNEFNRNDADLELIRVQYRRKNGDGAWINITEVPKAQLDNDVFKIVQWNTEGYQDGEYEMRAVTQCFGGQNAGISTVITGRIERTAPEIFGTPEPADGVLNAGDDISITFTEPIRCDKIIQADFFNNNNIGLYNAETDQLIDAVVTCQGDKIVIVPNVPNRFIENTVLRVEVDNIKDLADNLFVHKSWEFFVDRNPMRWSGGNVKVGKYQEDITTVTRQLVNTGGQALSYELSDVPGWVRVGPANGIIAPGAAQDITFVFDNSLSFGTYSDTIFAVTPLGNEPMPVYCRVMCPAPDWELDPTAYSGSMNFTLKLDIEGTLSTDEEDILAAFIDGELRGLAKLQLLPTLPPVGTQYRVFLTVFGDPEDDGKPITLDIWDAS
ncbi:MAG: LamG-like jellyroll fold domain-containing protein, partial [Bacteroidota bacterium]